MSLPFPDKREGGAHADHLRLMHGARYFWSNPICIQRRLDCFVVGHGIHHP